MAASNKVSEAYVELKSKGLKGIFGSLNNISAGTKSAGMGLQGLQRPVTGLTGKLGGLASKIGVMNIAMAAGAIAAAGMAVSIGVKAVRAASKLEDALAEVSTLVDTSKVNMQEFSDSLVGMSTEVLKSSSDLANGLYQVISAGVDTGDAIGMLKVAAKAATAGMTDTFTSVDLLTSILNSYNLEASETARVADLVFGTIKEGKTRFDQLASTMGRVLPIASQLNIPLNELLGSVAQLTKSGMSTAMAITAIRSAIMGFMNPAENVNEILGDQADLLSSNAIKTKGFVQSLYDLNVAIGGDEAALTKLLGRQEAVLASTGLVGKQMENTRETIEGVTKSIGEHNVAFEKMAKTMSAQVKQLELQWEGFLIKIGQKLLPELIELLKDANKLMEFFFTPGGERALKGISGDIAEIEEKWEGAKTNTQKKDALSSVLETYIKIGKEVKKLEKEIDFNKWMIKVGMDKHGTIAPDIKKDLEAIEELKKKYLDLYQVLPKKLQKLIQKFAWQTKMGMYEDKAFTNFVVEASKIAPIFVKNNKGLEKFRDMVVEFAKISPDWFSEPISPSIKKETTIIEPIKKIFSGDDLETIKERITGIVDQAAIEKLNLLELNEEAELEQLSQKLQKELNLIDGANISLEEKEKQKLAMENAYGQLRLNILTKYQKEELEAKKSFGESIKQLNHNAGIALLKIEGKNKEAELASLSYRLKQELKLIEESNLDIEEKLRRKNAMIEAFAQEENNIILKYQKKLTEELTEIGKHIAKTYGEIMEMTQGTGTPLGGGGGGGITDSPMAQNMDAMFADLDAAEADYWRDQYYDLKEEQEKEDQKEKARVTGGIQISQITGQTRDILVNLLSPLKNLNTTFPRMLGVLKDIRNVLTVSEGPVPHSIAGQIAAGSGLSGITVQGDLNIQVQEVSDISAEAIEERLYQDKILARRKIGRSVR